MCGLRCSLIMHLAREARKMKCKTEIKEPFQAFLNQPLLQNRSQALIGDVTVHSFDSYGLMKSSCALYLHCEGGGITFNTFSFH